MSEQSYAVFQRYMEKPTIDQLEKFCFDARTKGASGKTKLEHNYRYHSWNVHIPEDTTTAAYAAKPSPVPIKKRGVPTWGWLLILVACVILGVFV